MADIDPLVPVLAGMVVDSVWFLDSCDDEVEPVPSRREFLEAFPFTCGLVEEESCAVETSPGALVA
ncbi:hypothetical protein ACFVTF_05355 [Kitasatospora sp. NPDC057940]|uniref:hypothetical protein n=1 Tax=Kitasatospora sp. NPDC057940 TaxID=3346285 RepID=UPI0036DF2901